MSSHSYLPMAFALGLSAVTVYSHASSDPELDDLMAMLEIETEIATQNKMNADYVPGMVTVLHAEDLKQVGFSTVAEALNQVVGLYTVEDNRGDQRVIARGVGATLNASHLKLLVDGVAVNRATDASADWLLRLPLSQIDRIEVVRGPGSAVHGEYAFSGVVNIISRKANAIGVQVGSFDKTQIDGHVYREFESGQTMQLNMAAWQKSNSGLLTNPDNFATRGNGYSPGIAYDHEKGHTLQGRFNYQGYQLLVDHAQHSRGPAYGHLAALPGEADPRKETVNQISLNKPWQVNSSLRLQLALTHLSTTLNHAAYIPFPAGIIPPGGSEPLSEPQFVQNGNRDTTQRANVSVHWSGIAGHNIYLDAGYARYSVNSAFTALFDMGKPKQFAEPAAALIADGAERTLNSLTLQDQWQLNDALEVTLGARYDRYSDWGSHFSPRVATVWRLSDRHIVKAQYAEAFRPPTLAEAYPGPDSIIASPENALLKEEILKSTEASYIYRKANTTLRTTLYHTQIKDLIEFYIQPGQPPRWRNLADIDNYGVEIEWVQRIGRHWEWQAGLANTNAIDHLDEDKKLLGSIDRLANVSLIWHGQRSQHALHWRYVGDQEGWEIATRIPQTERFDAYNTLTYSFGLNNLFNVKGLQLSATAQNILATEYTSVPTPAQYPTGLPHGYRTVSLTLDYSL